ncbi:uncharacterized protein FOMMEDRAFT_31534 [Fomitiporia mediterranea MF3/22]|uniref:uncharacterized protein n=1 Tax=Fomitiporia mediterranea (strain MF3/22) TaxID=694068 RepID=UPI0004409549|nr:uncharacterized protein FOMMEDRAFT_31534 [Fomitiporia mediterranea MF3/22]EJC98977.1 hypothetical protein FOMMEDRAFT_31534 [Fomitiporia mediterranea MF3/22]
MNNGNGARSARSSPSDDGDGGNDEDHTAKLSGGNSRLNEESSNSALQRVKSLTQRNRLVLSKLASISSGSRLSTPSPTNVTRRSPLQSATTASTSTAPSSRLTRRRSESMSRASGSETERENANGNNAASDSEGLSETPTSTTGSHFRSASMAERRTSSSAFGESKSAFLDRSVRERSAEPSDVSKQRTRPESRADDIEAAALAAVAQSRRDSPIDARRRQPLPREFLGGGGGGNGESSTQFPQTPRRERTVSGAFSAQDSPSSSRATLHDSPMTPRTRAQRFSSIREITRKHQTRWLSQDMSPLKNGSDEEAPSPSRRVINGDSPRRNFVGESLRAAGLVKLREEGGEDVFGEGGRRLRISSEVGARPLTSRLEPSSRPGTRFSERPAISDNERHIEPRTPANPTYIAQRNAQTAKAERPSTSMAAYREEPRTAPPALRTYNSAYVITSDRDRDRQVGDVSSRPSSQVRNYGNVSSAAGERSGSSAAVGRSTASPHNLSSAAGADVVPEHTRLMLESLGMFESQLSRLPSLGNTTMVTIPELFRSAQNIVHAADALNNMLRRGNSHALDEQIDAELGEDGRAVDLVSLWRDVGADYRESVRVSDELVRTMTSFLLGVGKVLRESAAESMHNRTASLDDGAMRRRTPEVGPSADGRKSESSRLSSEGNRSSLDGKTRWNASSGEMGRTTTSFTSLHSASSTSSFRPATISKALADAELGHRSSDSIGDNELSSRKLNRLSLTGSRHLDSLQDLRDSKARTNQYSNADDDPVDSPSAAATARHQGTLPRRSNTVAVPPALPTLVSESLLSRRTSEKASTVSRRPKTSGPGSRAATSLFQTLSGTAEPTIAINKTQASPERPRHAPTSSMSRTFSRTGGAAAAGLQEQIERDVRKRTVSGSSAVESEVQSVRNSSDIERVERRPRASLDSNISGASSTRFSRDRRGTVTSLFSRS